MDNYKELIERYNSGGASNEDVQQIELLLEEGVIQLEQLHDLKVIKDQLSATEQPQPASSLDTKFYTMLAEEKRKARNSFSVRFASWWNSVWQYQLQWAYSLVLIMISGLAVYFWQNKTGSGDKIEQLTSEMQEMKEMLMLTMLEKNSTTERLRAVSFTTEMDTVSDKVANALLEILRNDENNNVRLAAIDALALYVNDPEVRQGLIESIQYQKSPLVQLAMAELMVALNETKSVKEFKPIIEAEETPREVKLELERAMQTLI